MDMVVLAHVPARAMEGRECLPVLPDTRYGWWATERTQPAGLVPNKGSYNKTKLQSVI